MSRGLIEIIDAAEPAARDRAVDAWCGGKNAAALLAACADLDAYRRREGNLYKRVRALFFIASIHRYHLPARPDLPRLGRTPYEGFRHLLERRFEEAIEVFLAAQRDAGPSETLSSALAAAHHALAFQTLADQVRRTVRSTHGNAWMFRLGHPLDQPLRVRRELVARESADSPHPLLRERTPVRMDLTHCGWSDIFFLGMDFPEGARVLNISIDLGVHGRDTTTTRRQLEERAGSGALRRCARRVGVARLVLDGAVTTPDRQREQHREGPSRPHTLILPRYARHGPGCQRSQANARARRGSVGVRSGARAPRHERVPRPPAAA